MLERRSDNDVRKYFKHGRLRWPELVSVSLPSPPKCSFYITHIFHQSRSSSSTRFVRKSEPLSATIRYMSSRSNLEFLVPSLVSFNFSAPVREDPRIRRRVCLTCYRNFFPLIQRNGYPLALLLAIFIAKLDTLLMTRNANMCTKRQGCAGESVYSKLLFVVCSA